MDLDEIKRGLRAEIKKRENEQYFTFQCNVRQMCKDVLAKLEEQESVIAELEEKLKNSRNAHKYWRKEYLIEYKECRHHKYKRCLAMARWCGTSAQCDEGLGAFKYRDWYRKWSKRWLKIAEQFKEAK